MGVCKQWKGDEKDGGFNSMNKIIEKSILHIDMENFWESMKYKY